MRGLCVVGALALGLVAGGPAHAAGERVVAVLYFDNNTGDRELDVLQKGFADMMITDLAGIAGITVVERDRLQALLDELALQQGKYFDARTAVKVGKGLGAAYAVTGSFAAVKPQLRIDMRMIDVATGKIVLTAKVQGKATELFDLEQTLVGKFAAGLAVTFAPADLPRTKVPDVKTLVEYSRGIDLADRGQLEPASKQLASVVRMAPAFALARIRRDEMVKRLEEARSRRSQALDDSARALDRAAEGVLKGRIAGLSKDDAKRHLAYRVVRGWFVLRALKEHLSEQSVQVALPGHEAKARALLRAYADNGERLIAELDIYAAEHLQILPNGVRHLDTSIGLPVDDERRAREAGYEDRPTVDPVGSRHELARFLLLGEGDDSSDHRIMMGPPLGNLEPRWGKRGFALLAQAWALADRDLKDKPYLEYQAISALETWGEVLMFRGKVEEAVAKWQEVLDRYPTSQQFVRVENKIKGALGLVHEHQARELARYAKGLAGCDDMDLRVGIDTVLYRRMRMAGVQAIHDTVKEIEKACQGNPNARRYWDYLYSHAANAFGRRGHCKEFEAYMKRYLDAGGSARDTAGWRKNYTKCPVP